MAPTGSTLPLPSSLIVSLSIKIGKALATSRSYAEQGIELSFDTQDDSYGVFRRKVSDRVKTAVEVFASKHNSEKDKPTLEFPDSFEIYAKLGRHTKQQDYVLLSSNNLNARFGGGGDFQFMIFVYLEKKTLSTQQIRRATENRIAEAAQRIMSIDRPVQPGPAALGYLSAYYARQIESPDYENLPDNPTIQQLNHIDRQQANLDDTRNQRQSEDAMEYQPLRFRINGDQVTFFVNITQLRSLLGLPPYNLYQPFRPPMQEAASSSMPNVRDVDHCADANSEGSEDTHIQSVV
ncbi:hypothetical protein AC1031_009286 [Aphanomyces cochlioides]|nr:hypothetical protein AC1031_009286 [Aphanomyces cochlioides]